MQRRLPPLKGVIASCNTPASGICRFSVLSVISVVKLSSGLCNRARLHSPRITVNPPASDILSVLRDFHDLRGEVVFRALDQGTTSVVPLKAARSAFLAAASSQPIRPTRRESTVSSYAQPQRNTRQDPAHPPHSIPGNIPGGHVAKSGTWRNIVASARRHRRPVERIYLPIARRPEPPVNRRGISLPLLEPEHRPLAIPESPQIGVPAFAHVRHKKSDTERLERGLIERQRAFNLAHAK